MGFMSLTIPVFKIQEESQLDRLFINNSDPEFMDMRDVIWNNNVFRGQEKSHWFPKTKFERSSSNSES